MVYTIYDGPRQLANGAWYWAYAAWYDARDQKANRGKVAVKTLKGIIRCDLTNDHIAPHFRTDHHRLVADAHGNETIEQYTLSIESQVAEATLAALQRAAQRGERGCKTLPVQAGKAHAVEALLTRMQEQATRKRNHRGEGGGK